ncbi:ATP-binding protein [Methylomagnum sp.]
MLTDFLTSPALGNLVPHGTCLLWQPGLLLLHAVSDGLITAAYYSIPAALIYFVSKRPDLRFRWIFVLFGVFILACGTTHLMEIWTLWHPDYVLAGFIKAITALASLGTAAVLWPLIPHALALPSPARLAEANERLQREIEDRKSSEQRIRQLNDELERMVEQRTSELLATNHRLEEEIRERQRFEASLSESENRYRTLFEQMPDALVLVDAETGHIVDFNEKAHQNLGYARNEFQALRLEDIDRIESAAGVAHHIANIKAVGSELFEAEHRTRDGEIRHVRVNARIVEIAGRQFIQSIFTDVSAYKQLELALRAQQQKLRRAKDAAEAANRAKTEFLASISHELRTPMNAILGYTQIMQREPPASPKQAEFIDSIRRSGTHLMTLIDDLLDLSKIESGKLDIARSIFGLAEFLDGIAEMFVLKSRQKGLRFRFEKTEPLPEFVFGDDKRLRQILINLLSNAVKFTQAGRVEFRITHEGETGRFEIEDTGPGIAAEDVDRIFAPFERLEYHPSGEGSGLGLAISKRLAELMQGKLDVVSTLGQGSLFRIAIPLPRVAQPVARPHRKQPVTGYRGDIRRILIADDNPDNLTILAAVLESVGFATDTATNGREALEKFGAFAPDLVLMDLAMPEMDGTEATQRLRATERGRAAKIIAVTANAFEGTRQICLASGFDNFISKPLDIDDLLDLIQATLGLVWDYEADSS